MIVDWKAGNHHIERDVRGISTFLRTRTQSYHLLFICPSWGWALPLKWCLCFCSFGSSPCRRVPSDRGLYDISGDFLFTCIYIYIVIKSSPASGKHAPRNNLWERTSWADTANMHDFIGELPTCWHGHSWMLLARELILRLPHATLSRLILGCGKGVGTTHPKGKAEFIVELSRTTYANTPYAAPTPPVLKHGSKFG